MASLDQLLHVISVHQAGAFTAAQAEAVDVSRHQLDRWVRRGAGRRVHGAVFVHAIVSRTIQARRWAAVLAGGEGTLVGGLAALDDWQLERRSIDAVEIVVCRRHRTIRGTRMLQSLTVHDEDRVVRHGRPTTSVERTLVDVANRRSTGQLCKLISEACFRQVLVIGQLRRTIDRNAHRPGIARLRVALAKYTGDENGSDSHTEDRFARMLDRAGVEYRQNVWLRVGGERVRLDFHVPKLNLAIEIDPPHHLLPDKQREDKLKSALITMAGLDLLRVPGDELQAGAREVARRMGT